MAIMVSLAFGELMLRTQQWLGPLYDLGPRPDRTSYSDVVNHQPPPHFTLTLAGPGYGEHAGHSIDYRYDDLGLRVPQSVGAAENCRQVGTILFMGDSFIEGYDIPNTIPDRVARLLAQKYGLCARILNAGHSSYSPAIFVPLARRLLKEVSPDYIVVDVDETDLADDTFRYEKLIVRNDKGENVGVLASPQMKSVGTAVELSGTRFLYMQRLAERLYVRFVLMPRVKAAAPHPFAFSSDMTPGAEKRFESELAILKRNLTELVEVLRKGTGSAERIVFIRHPHIFHLETSSRPPLFSGLIGMTVGRTVTSLGASYFDATPELAERFGRDPEPFYWKYGDMHLSFRGMEQYADVVAAFLAKKIRGDLKLQ